MSRLLAKLAPILPAVASLFRWVNRQRVGVLMYHGVLPADEALAKDDWLQVTCDEFAAQMAFLQRHYTPLPLRDVLNPATRLPLSKPAVVITFDDGYANNFHHALPILQHYGIPATIFLTTSHIGTDRFFWWDRLRLSMQAGGRCVPAAWAASLKRLPAASIDAAVDLMLREQSIDPLPGDAAPGAYRCLTVDELQTMKNSGLVDFGSHTAGHEIIEHLSDADLLGTLAQASRDLQAWGCRTDLFAAPNGDYQDRQIALLQQAGIGACVSTQEGLWSPTANRYRIPRFGIGRGMSPARFALKLSGAESLLARWRRSRQGGY
ncbi:MAG: polysaccharide deacetylase family protein [Dechloromonas sp.]|nr:polysaccharide deacetylase family protein [Dechloromonas sp.]